MRKERRGPGDDLGTYSRVVGLRLCVLVLLSLFLVISGMVFPANAQEESVTTLPVAGFEFSGNDSISSETLAALLHDAVGKELTLSDLIDQAIRITRHYREQGFVVASAFLPQQEVANGIVRIEVLEGRYGQVTLDNASRLRDDVAHEHIASLEPGDLIEQSTLERTTLILNDLPGVHAQTTFRAGQRVGTSDLVVWLTDDSPWSGSLTLDNHGSGGFQSRLGVSWSNPRGYGDRLSLGVGLLSGASRSGKLTYSAPIGGQGLIGSVSIDTSERRQSLGSTPIVTDSRTTGVLLEYPVVRTQSANQRIGLALNSVTQRRTIGEVLVDESRIARAAVEWQGDESLANGGSLRYSLTATRGTLSLAPDDVVQADTGSAQTAGAFAHLHASATVRRPLWPGFTLNVEMQGQVASKNLHSSEKMSVAGVNGVRAYGEGSVSADLGWLVRTEVQRSFRWPAWGVVGNWTAFADVGGAHINRALWTGAGGENVTGIAGIGGGLTIVRGNWLVEVINAYPVGPNRVDGERGGRVWLRTTWQF